MGPFPSTQPLFSMYFNISLLEFQPPVLPLIQRNLLILHLRSFLLPLSCSGLFPKDNDTDKDHRHSFQSSSQRKTFPYVFHFPLVLLVYPWGMLLPHGRKHAGAAVELSPSWLLSLDYLLPPVKDTYKRAIRTIVLSEMWPPMSGSTVSGTHIWCVFPIGMGDSPNLSLLHLGSHD